MIYMVIIVIQNLKLNNIFFLNLQKLLTKGLILYKLTKCIKQLIDKFDNN